MTSCFLALALLLGPPVDGADGVAKTEVREQPRQKPAQNADSATPPTVANKVLSDEADRRRRYKHSHGDDGAWTRNDFIQAITALAAILYLFATVRILFVMLAANTQAKNANEASLKLTRETFEISRRPYLHVVSFDPAPRPAFSGNNPVEVIAVLRNTGDSTAHEVMSWPFATRLPRDNEFDVRWCRAMPPERGTTSMSMFGVGPGEEYTPDWPPISNSLDGLDDGSTTLYYACVIVYRDDFQKWHVYKFSHRYDIGTGKWVKYRDLRAITTLDEMDEPYLKAALEQRLRDNQA